MKKLSFSIISFLVLSLMFVGNVAVQASLDGKPAGDYQGKTGFLPDISKFKIDIEKPKKEIHHSLDSAKPLRESFRQAIGEIQTSLEAVKQDRTPETQRQLHSVFSKNILRIEKRMVGVTKEKYRIKDSFDVDHCFPFCHWPNNDLWNLMPTRPQANSRKSDKIPSSELLEKARPMILEWWDMAYNRDQFKERFITEAHAALPGINEIPETSHLKVYYGLQNQRIRLKVDQQLTEWDG